MHAHAHGPHRDTYTPLQCQGVPVASFRLVDTSLRRPFGLVVVILDSDVLLPWRGQASVAVSGQHRSCWHGCASLRCHSRNACLPGHGLHVRGPICKKSAAIREVLQPAGRRVLCSIGAAIRTGPGHFTATVGITAPALMQERTIVAAVACPCGQLCPPSPTPPLRSLCADV